MLSFVPISKDSDWDELVRSFPEYDVYYLSSYVKAFKNHGDGEPYLVYFDNGKTRAINVVMKRDIAASLLFKNQLEKDKWYDLSTPYGYGGFLVHGSDYEELEKEYTRYCRDANIVTEFVRFHPILGNGYDLVGIYEVQELGVTIHIDLSSPEIIWENLTSKNRNMIRKAKKLGVNIYWGRSPDLYRKFVSMYNHTMNIKKADSYYYFKTEFLDRVLYDLRYNSMVFYAVHEENIIAMAIILFCNTQMHYHLSASDYHYRQFAATNLMLYEASLWGYANGYKTFHLGGGLGAAEDSLYKFKKSFNRNSENRFLIGKKIFNRNIYDELIELRKSIGDFDEESTYFPLYRS